MLSAKTNPLRVLTRSAAVGAVAIAGVAVGLQATAGAVPAPPFSTTTTVKAAPKNPVSGQAVTFTATVKASHAQPTPGGQVVFTVTGGGGFNGTCDAGNTVTLSGGTAQCAFSGGLTAASSSYTVKAVYTDTVDSNYVTSTGMLTQAVGQGTTTTTVMSSANPSVTGQPVTFTAAVTESAPATGPLSGSVTFAGVTCDGGNTVPVSGGLASCTISSGLTPSGSPYTVTGTYGSDPNFAGSTSPKLKQTVSSDTTTVVLSATPNTCSGDICTAGAGTPLSFTGTVTASGLGGGTPTGSLVFSILPAGQTKAKKGFTCDGGSNTIALNGTPGDDTATCSFAAGLPAAVYYTVTATLSDPSYTGSSAALFERTGDAGTNTAIAHPNGITAGVSFPVTATVTPVGGGGLVPTGLVEISVCGPNSNGNNGCQGTNEPLQPDGTATLNVQGGEFPGEYTVQAFYPGDTNFQGSASPKKSIHIATSPTSITVTSSENPSIDGDSVNLTAQVQGSADSAGSTLLGPPSGSVTFTITDPTNATYTCQSGNVVPLNNGPLDEGVATCFLPPGTLTDPAAPGGSTDYTVNVSYPSDGNYQSSHTNYTQVVVPAVS